MKILNVADEAFKAYGKVVKGLDVSDLLEALKETPKPDDVIYVASDEKLEDVEAKEKSKKAKKAKKEEDAKDEE